MGGSSSCVIAQGVGPSRRQAQGCALKSAEIDKGFGVLGKPCWATCVAARSHRLLAPLVRLLRGGCYDSAVPAAFEELVECVQTGARALGRNTTRWPGLSFFHADSVVSGNPGASGSVCLCVIVQGSKDLVVGEHCYTYDPRNYLVLTGAHEYIGTVTQTPYYSLSLEIPPPVVAKVLVALTAAAPPAGPGPQVPAGFVSELDDTLCDVLVRFLRALDSEVETRVVAPLALEELTFRLIQCEHASALRQAGGGSEGGQIIEAMSYIRAHASESLSVAQIAGKVAMSPSNFAHRFKDVARVTPMRYLKRVRLERARVLLVDSMPQAAEVAHAVGYASPSHFNRDFRELYGVPPAEYARQFAMPQG